MRAICNFLAGDKIVEMESRRPRQEGEASEEKDETFMNLLSSQRRLLSEISSGAQSAPTAPSRRHNRPPYSARLSGELVHNRMNQSISGPLQNELSYSKSSSTGTDRFVGVEADPAFTFGSFETKVNELIVENESKKPAVKRAPSLGLGHSLSFLDSDRGSTGSPSNQDGPLFQSADNDGDGEDQGEDDDDDDLSSIEPLDYKYDCQPTLLINELTALDEAMARSQQSQLAIHNWDKSMGLKRSHSKTMRLSSRSRKKVRAFLQREIALVAQLDGGGTAQV